MAKHPISSTAFVHMDGDPTDEEIVEAYRRALVKAAGTLEARTEVHRSAQGSVPAGPVLHTLVVLAAHEVECPKDGCRYG